MDFSVYDFLKKQYIIGKIGRKTEGNATYLVRHKYLEDEFKRLENC